MCLHSLQSAVVESLLGSLLGCLDVIKKPTNIGFMGFGLKVLTTNIFTAVLDSL